jgi:hypothetical protein
MTYALVCVAGVYSLGWRPKTPLRDGMQVTCAWIEQQVRKGAAVVEYGGRPASALP